MAILEAISSVQEWQSLGLKLGLKKHQLDAIAIDKRGIVNECKMEMVSKWLNSNKASWQCLVKALRSPLLEKTSLAINIAKQHPLKE